MPKLWHNLLKYWRHVWVIQFQRRFDYKEASFALFHKVTLFFSLKKLIVFSSGIIEEDATFQPRLHLSSLKDGVSHNIFTLLCFPLSVHFLTSSRLNCSYLNCSIIWSLNHERKYLCSLNLGLNILHKYLTIWARLKTYWTHEQMVLNYVCLNGTHIPKLN